MEIYILFGYYRKIPTITVFCSYIKIITKRFIFYLIYLWACLANFHIIIRINYIRFIF